jgi:hypothetical protein
MTKQDMTPKERAAAAKKAREFDAASKSARRAAREAVRLAGLPKRTPTEADRSRLPSQPARVLAGQTDIYGMTHGFRAPPEEAESDE